MKCFTISSPKRRKSRGRPKGHREYMVTIVYPDGETKNVTIVKTLAKAKDAAVSIGKMFAPRVKIKTIKPVGRRK